MNTVVTGLLFNKVIIVGIRISLQTLSHNRWCVSTPQWDNNQTHTTVTTPHIHHVTFWCTGGCRDKLYTTPPITR